MKFHNDIREDYKKEIYDSARKNAIQLSVDSGIVVEVKYTYPPTFSGAYDFEELVFVINKEHKFGSLDEVKKAIKNKVFL
jgi:hypothetical protein